LPSDLPSELSRWFENMQRLLDRLAQTAEQQKQLREMVERLVRENEGLREDINHLRSMVADLTGDRAETAQVLRNLAAYVTAVKDQVLRRSREGRSPE
jgi:regulator of replication initiation timing